MASSEPSYAVVPDQPVENEYVTQLKAGADAVSAWLEVHEVNKTTQEVLQKAHDQFRGYVVDGPFSYKIASFVAGAAMIFFGITGVFVTGGFMNTLINFYQLGFGLLTVGLESNKELLSKEFKAFLFEYFRFMFTLVGRGCFYILAGILLTAAHPWPNFFVGIFTLGTGFASIYYGFKASKKLQALKFALTDEVGVRQAFGKADVDGDGKVTVEQFAGLLAALEVNLDRQELEAAVAIVGNDGGRLITADAFVEWYNENLLVKEPTPPL